MKTDKKYWFNADETIQLVSSCPIQSVDSKTEPKAKERKKGSPDTKIEP